jgi:hypothetical protein
MDVNDDMLIRIYDSWNGWQNAEVRLRSLRGIHWRQPAHAPHELLFGFVSCCDIVTGRIPHDCDEDSAPHDLLVCVLKRHVVASAYAVLQARSVTASPLHPLPAAAAPLKLTAGAPS